MTDRDLRLEIERLGLPGNSASPWLAWPQTFSRIVSTARTDHRITAGPRQNLAAATYRYRYYYSQHTLLHTSYPPQQPPPSSLALSPLLPAAITRVRSGVGRAPPSFASLSSCAPHHLRPNPHHPVSSLPKDFAQRPTTLSLHHCLVKHLHRPSSASILSDPPLPVTRLGSASARCSPCAFSTRHIVASHRVPYPASQSGLSTLRIPRRTRSSEQACRCDNPGLTGVARRPKHHGAGCNADKRSKTRQSLRTQKWRLV